GGVERPFRRRHLALNVSQRLLDDPPIRRVLGDTKCLGVHLDKLTIVVQHLFEVRHGPGALGAVTMETAAELVVDAARRHLVKLLLDYVKELFIFAAYAGLKQELDPTRHWNLRPLEFPCPRTESAVLRIELLLDRVDDLAIELAIQLHQREPRRPRVGEREL